VKPDDHQAGRQTDSLLIKRRYWNWHSLSWLRKKKKKKNFSSQSFSPYQSPVCKTTTKEEEEKKERTTLFVNYFPTHLAAFQLHRNSH